MLWIAISLGLIGLLLSAFFSGSETGFYRLAPIRLQIDSIEGDRLAEWQLWLTNHASVFVATTLVGNNIANYLTSFAIVMAAQAVYGGKSALVGELIAPMLLTPVLFVYGELTPKYLFLHAPHRLLRTATPLFLVFVLLFLPISVVLYALNRAIASVMGLPHDIVQSRLARRELRRALDEGHEAGILRASQWELAKGLFAVVKEEVSKYAVPLSSYPTARSNLSKAALLRAAKRHQIAELPLIDVRRSRRLAGYVRVIDLRLSDEESFDIRPLMEISPEESPVNVLLRLEAEDEELGVVLGRHGQPAGVITADRLRDLLFQGGDEKKKA